jgi:uncharacterized protein (TIGR02677 family)
MSSDKRSESRSETRRDMSKDKHIETATTVADQPDAVIGNLPPDDSMDQARLLFRYLGGEEWREYRAILSVFADTFFTEFSPDDVIAALRDMQFTIDESVVPDRLASLRGWGNLSVSTSVGNPSSLDDYYKRRHRYLITRAGQEVYDRVEGILHRVDEVSDLQAGRLRDIHRALNRLLQLCEQGVQRQQRETVADAVRAVFDPHQSFSTEITQFFASINQWQSRYDLEDHEITFFAEVLVSYVSEQLVEIERMARPVATTLQQLTPHLDAIVKRAQGGLAARVDDAGLADTVSVQSIAGTRMRDWDHLMKWFGAAGDGKSRLDDLTRQAIAAVRTLTSNLTRLSRVGAGVASRRRDLLKLAKLIDAADNNDDAQQLMAAALGLYPSRHLSMLSEDAEDPVATSTPWQDAPRALIPISLRERGERQQRGTASKVRNREAEREALRQRRVAEREAETRTAKELLDVCENNGRLSNIDVSAHALRRLRQLLSAASARREHGTAERQAQDRELHCKVKRVQGETVFIHCPEGTLTLQDAEVYLHPVETSGLPH